MKFRAKNLNAKKLLNGNTEFSMEVEDKQNRLISQLNAQKQLLNSDLEVGIDKWRNKRSGGHNRLFWDMCGYLSDHINDPTITQMTIYRDLIREYGVSTAMAAASAGSNTVMAAMPVRRTLMLEKIESRRRTG